MTIGIAIPACKSYIGYLEILLKNISKQTIIPDEISISISDIDNYKPEYDYGLNLKIKSFSESKNGAENRNEAAKELSTDIVSFFDCDDLMHPQRTEFLLKSFKNEGVKVIVHDYEMDKGNFDNFMNSYYDFIDFEPEVIDMLFDNFIYPLDITKSKKYHNAHVSVKKEVLNLHRYNEEFWAPDSLFNKEIVQNGYKISLLRNKLSFYTLR